MSGHQQEQEQEQQQQPPPFMPPAGFAAFASMFPGGMPNPFNFMAAGVGHPRLHGDNTDEMISAIESNIYRDNSKMTEADVDGELSFALQHETDGEVATYFALIVCMITLASGVSRPLPTCRGTYTCRIE